MIYRRKNKVTLKERIDEFPPLPSLPALTKVNRAIQEAHGSMAVKDQLRDVDDGLKHENLNVRYMVVYELPLRDKCATTINTLDKL
jgi:serine/threonine-protein kinase ATR